MRLTLTGWRAFLGARRRESQPDEVEGGSETGAEAWSVDTLAGGAPVTSAGDPVCSELLRGDAPKSVFSRVACVGHVATVVIAFWQFLIVSAKDACRRKVQVCASVGK